MHIRRQIMILALVVFLCSSCTVFPSPLSKQTPSTNTVNARITLQGTTKTIPDNIIGFSIELSLVCAILQQDAADPVHYEQLYKNFGSSVLHIGGHSADLSVWEPDGSMPLCNQAHPVVTRVLLDALFAFARRIHWSVIWTLNLISNNPREAAEEAAAVKAAGGSTLIAFSIGNEPELYVRQGFRPAGWGYVDYHNEWVQNHNAILRLVPSAQFIGPEPCCNTPFFSDFLADESKDIIALSQHYYTGSSTESIPYILSKQTAQRFLTEASNWVALAQSRELPLEITESNSLYGGGRPGVSNSLAAAIWATDYILQATELGVRQVDFQFGYMAFYNAITDTGLPTALYYGLLLDYLVTKQALLLPVKVQTSLNLTSYSTINREGLLSVILINKDLNTNALVEIDPGRNEKSASVIRLLAPKITSTSGITLGGQAVSTQGTLTPVSAALPFHGAALTLSVPSGSVAVVTFHP